MQTVEVRGLDHGIPMAAEIAIALIIGDHDDHVRVQGAISRRCSGRSEEGNNGAEGCKQRTLEHLEGSKET